MHTEDRRMQKISALAALNVFGGMRPWRECWDSFKRGQDINAQIATDIDRIECYVQLVDYANREGCDIPDAETWAKGIADGLISDIGKKMFDCLRHEGAPLLQWYR